MAASSRWRRRVPGGRRGREEGRAVRGGVEDCGRGGEEDCGRGGEEDCGRGGEEDSGRGGEEDSGRGGEKDCGRGQQANRFPTWPLYSGI